MNDYDDVFLYRRKTKRIKVGSETHKQFLQENYIICEHCGYNNKKTNVEKYGTCLKCRSILDPKSYLKFKIRTNC